MYSLRYGWYIRLRMSKCVHFCTTACDILEEVKIILTVKTHHATITRLDKIVLISKKKC